MMALDDFTATVAELRPRFLWRWAKGGPAHCIALIAATFDTAPPYRSPHSTAGNYTLCKPPTGASVPLSCVIGGWRFRDKCLRDECDCPFEAPNVAGVCAYRVQGAPALTPQRSESVDGCLEYDKRTGEVTRFTPPRIPRSPRPIEIAVKEWVARATCSAARDGSEAVKRAALAYLDDSRNCKVSDIYALGVWMRERLEEEKPWR